MDIIEISVLITAIAFCLLVFFVIKTLLSVQRSLSKTEQTIDQLQDQVDGLSKETTALIQSSNQLIQNSNELILDIDRKSKALDPVFQSVHDIGQATTQFSNSVKEISATISNNINKGTEKVADHEDNISHFIRIATIGYNLTQKWKNRKK